jgi:hypothetical protein
VVAKLRAKTEAADTSSTEAAHAARAAQSIATFVDEHHDF